MFAKSRALTLERKDSNSSGCSWCTFLPSSKSESKLMNFSELSGLGTSSIKTIFCRVDTSVTSSESPSNISWVETKCTTVLESFKI